MEHTEVIKKVTLPITIIPQIKFLVATADITPEANSALIIRYVYDRKIETFWSEIDLTFI